MTYFVAVVDPCIPTVVMGCLNMSIEIWPIFKAQAKLRFASTFNRLKFLSIFLFFFLSDVPNLDLNNLTDLLIKSTLVQLIYSIQGNTVNIKD